MPRKTKVNDATKTALILLRRAGRGESDSFTTQEITALWAWVDGQVEKQMQDADTEGPARDRLFDVMMARFDVLQGHRQGFSAILRHVTHDPRLWPRLAPVLGRSMATMLRLAGAGSDPLRVLGLAAIYAATLRVWAHDASPDLSATMAELDRRLGQVDRIISYISNK